VVKIFRIVCAGALALAGSITSAAGQQAARIIAEPGRSYTVSVRTLKELKYARAFRTTVRQQYDFSCGSAAIATLLTYHYGREVDEATVFRRMFEVGDQAKIQREGFSLLDMKRYLDSSGYRADGIKASIDELAKVGVPAIILVQENGYNHFVVVKGARGGRVVVGDPSIGTRVLSRKYVESIWVGGILFVIRSHRKAAAFNASADWQARLAAPIAQGVSRESLGAFTLSLPQPDHF
jgi:predicted double-glycine peptidase